MSMEEIPNIEIDPVEKAEMIKKGIEEIRALKTMVQEKRKALRLLGENYCVYLGDEEKPITHRRGRPPREQDIRKAEAEAKAKAKAEEEEAKAKAKAIPPEQSPFFDPKAPPTKSQKITQEEAPESDKKKNVSHMPAVSTEVKVPCQPSVDKKHVIETPVTVRKTMTKEAPIKINRVGHDGKWF